MDRWYVLRNGVRGPFTLRQLLRRIDGDSPVCPAGKGEFKEAERYPDLRKALQNRKEILRQGEREKKPELEPTLRRLERIVQHATNKQLRREFERFREQYDARERKLIEREMRRRDLLPDEDTK